MLQLSAIDSTAHISKTAKIGDFCKIGKNVIIGDNVVIEDYALIGDNVVIGKSTKIGTYTKIGEGVTIGDGCSFTSFCEVRDNCKLGNRVMMGSRGTLSAGTIIEDDVVMKYAFVVTDTPDLTQGDIKIVGTLQKGSRFGASVVIMPGVNVGENAEIGACSLVRNNVPDNEIWFGMPAKFYKKATT